MIIKKKEKFFSVQKKSDHLAALNYFLNFSGFILREQPIGQFHHFLNPVFG